MRLYFREFLVVMFVFSAVASHAGGQQTKIGWLEKVTINNTGFPVSAKIDTGADNSSISARTAKTYTKQDQQWVKFTLKNNAGRVITFDKPILRTTRIKMKKGVPQRRFVIELDICLGAIQRRAQVNLIDRSHFNEKVLIGRSFLGSDYLIDASQVYLTKPQCKKYKPAP